MKKCLVIISILCTINTLAQPHNNGVARIVDINYFYEYNDSYWPFDFFIKNETTSIPSLKIQLKSPNSIVIENNYSDYYTGQSIKFHLDSNLNITNTEYYSYTDVLIEGVKEIESIENVILYFNQNPFHDTNGLIGQYTALIKTETIVNDTASEMKNIESIYYHRLNGKFKVYSSDEKKMTKKWCREQMEMKIGIVDLNNIVEFPETDPIFCYGIDSVKSYLKQKTDEILKNSSPDQALFAVTINEFGLIENVSFESTQTIKKDALEKLESKAMNLNCWSPAINHGKSVKSTLYIRAF